MVSCFNFSFPKHRYSLFGIPIPIKVLTISKVIKRFVTLCSIDTMTCHLNTSMHVRNFSTVMNKHYTILHVYIY